MKILQIIYSLSSGGAERFVVDLSNEYSMQGHDVTLCVLRNDLKGTNGFYKNEILSKVKYISLGLPDGFNPSKILSIYKLIRKVNPEVVHCHHNLVNYVFPISLINNKIKYFHTIHNDAPKEVGSKFEYYLRKFFYTSEKFKAITISAETSSSFVQYYGTKKYTEIYNGRTMPLKSENYDSVVEFFRELKKENNFIFVHIGRNAPQKNQKMLINVINRLNKNGRQIALLIIGDGFDQEHATEIRELASNKIAFIGQVHNIADYLMNADAFCLSSIFEGMPITLIESLACECIPICTPVGGIVNSIKNGINGFISESTSEEDYYKACLDFLEKGQNVNKNNLIQTYRTLFSIEECAKQHLNLYTR